MERRGNFDYILLETSGLADPGNIAPLFWVDDGLGSTIYLDGIVTLVDAKNILTSLDESPAPESSVSANDKGHDGPHVTTAHLQISHADVIILNKTDTVSAEQLRKVKDRIQAVNSLAKIHETQYGQVPALEGTILDLHAYDSIQSLDLSHRERVHSHLDPVCSSSSTSIKKTIPSNQYEPKLSLLFQPSITNTNLLFQRQSLPSPSPSPF